MSFVELISSYPVVPLTVLLGIAVGYWIFALVTGAVFDGGDAASGAIKGASEAVSGAVKGAAESMTGAMKGVADGVADSIGGHADVGADGGDHHIEGGFLAMLGLAKVPVTITWSVMLLVAWTVCAMATEFLRPEGVLLGTALLGGSLTTGLFGAALLLRPLGKALSQAKPARRRDVLGQLCTVTSGKVDGGFGTASIDDGGAGLIVHIVCSKDNELKKGDRAILVEFDAQKNVYEVEPVDWLLPQEVEALKDPQTAAQVLSGRIRRH